MTIAASDEDRAYRNAWGVQGKRPFGRGLRAPYYTVLPDAPRGPYVTRGDAERYVVQIERVQEMLGWTKSEREKLRVLRLKWKARAAGHDQRFNVLGAQGGVNERYRVRTRLEQARDTLLTRPGSPGS